MQPRTWLYPLLLTVAAALILAGCGRPTLPGQQFKGELRTVPGAAEKTPLPEKPVLEWGPSDAKVRVVAFYPIDEPHQRLIDLLESFPKTYPGEVYAKYIDYRTPEGAQLFTTAQLTVPCVAINGSTSVDLSSPLGPRTVDFVKDMGRYWTADDLEEAVAQAVAKAYGKKQTPSG
jgi:hypothetical protein